MYGPAAPDESGALPTRCASVLAGHEGAVLNVRYNASGAFALSCGKDRTLRLWSLAKGALIKTYTGHGHEARCALRAFLVQCAHASDTRAAAQVRDVACTTDNNKLASVGGDRQARARAALLVFRIPSLTPLTPPVQVFYWDVATGRTIRKFKGHDRRALGVQAARARTPAV